jgi:hypothetical protein
MFRLPVFLTGKNIMKAKRLASYLNYLQAFIFRLEAASGFEPEMAILQTAIQ